MPGRLLLQSPIHIGSGHFGGPGAVFEVGIASKFKSKGYIGDMGCHVSKFEVQDLGNRVQLQITFTYRAVTQTYKLVARDP